MHLWSTPFGLEREGEASKPEVVSLGYATYETVETSDE